jgi:hypothetical protein
MLNKSVSSCSNFTRFCEDCINRTWSANGNQTCPVCRTSADGLKETDFDMIEKMSSQSINCSKCSKHVRSCAPRIEFCSFFPVLAAEVFKFICI